MKVSPKRAKHRPRAGPFGTTRHYVALRGTRVPPTSSGAPPRGTRAPPTCTRVHARSKDLWDRHVVPSRARRCNGCRSPRRGSPWFPRPGRRVRCGRASGLEVPARLATPTWLHGFRWPLSRSNQCRRPLTGLGRTYPDLTEPGGDANLDSEETGAGAGSWLLAYQSVHAGTGLDRRSLAMTRPDLDRVFAAVARADPHCLRHRESEDLPVTDATGVGRALDGLEHLLHRVITDDDLELDLRKEINGVLGAPVQLCVSLLTYPQPVGGDVADDPARSTGATRNRFLPGTAIPHPARRASRRRRSAQSSHFLRSLLGREGVVDPFPQETPWHRPGFWPPMAT